MRYYRIVHEAHHKNPFSCSYNAGRWNPKGTGMIYAGSTPSVSLLEYMCIKGNTVSKDNWFMIVFDIANTSLIGALEPEHLPREWNILPHGRATQNFGKEWLLAKEFPFLRVPSARMNLAFYPEEHNLLINPDFPLLSDLLKVTDSVPFTYLLGR
jgi:RES domain-containing protein